MSGYGKPLFESHMRYCVRCCIPETEEGTNFDALGICQACRSSEQKMHIDWVERERELRRILDDARAQAGDNYDCIVPISGGKDSTFQLHVLTKVYGMKPLAVTFSHNWFSETGWANLVNALEKFHVDHIMFTPNRALVNKLARRSLHEIGDSCWHCHAGVGSFPLHVAAKFKIPLLVYGEPAAEGQGTSSYLEPEPFDRDYFIRISARKRPEEMVGGDLTAKDLYPFRWPSQEECDAVGVRTIHLGSYIFWDDERQTEFVRDTYGWRETQMENTYKRYKSAECIMPGMHDFTLYLKRGYGRATFQANLDVRNGLLTREEGFELAKQFDPQRPEALDYFLEITGMTEAEVVKVMEGHRKGPLRGATLPILPKPAPNEERIRPVFQQLVERGRTSRQPTYGEEEPAAARAGRRALPESFLDLSVRELVAGYERGDWTPTQVAQMVVRRVRALEPQVHAWVVFSPGKLLGQAQAAEHRWAEGAPRGALEAVPVGIKDVFNTREFPTQMGSPLWKDFTPGNDARLVFHVQRAGGLLAGKTVTAEFAVHALGQTLNPHDPARNPGTSSSGSAAAVATGMVPVALGTQTAGSIVRPASFCGVWGCKPSFGLLPRTGVLKTTDSLDTLGFFVGRAEDLRRVFDALRVHGPDYPVSHAALTDPARQHKSPDRPWRVALVRTHTWDHAHGYARDALRSWAAKVGEAPEVEVVEADLPPGMARAHEVHATIYDRALANYFAEEYTRKELVSPVMNGIIERGMTIPASAYDGALREQERLAAAMDRFLQDYDVMLSLSTAGAAPPRDEVERPDPALMWTLTHLPVVNAPVFTSPEGLPFGAQLAARRYNDPLLFRFIDHLRTHGLVPEGPNPRAPVVR